MYNSSLIYIAAGFLVWPIWKIIKKALGYLWRWLAKWGERRHTTVKTNNPELIHVFGDMKYVQFQLPSDQKNIEWQLLSRMIITRLYRLANGEDVPEAIGGLLKETDTAEGGKMPLDKLPGRLIRVLVHPSHIGNYGETQSNFQDIFRPELCNFNNHFESDVLTIAEPPGELPSDEASRNEWYRNNFPIQVKLIENDTIPKSKAIAIFRKVPLELDERHSIARITTDKLGQEHIYRFPPNFISTKRSNFPITKGIGNQVLIGTYGFADITYSKKNGTRDFLARVSVSQTPEGVNLSQTKVAIQPYILPDRAKVVFKEYIIENENSTKKLVNRIESRELIEYTVTNTANLGKSISIDFGQESTWELKLDYSTPGDPIFYNSGKAELLPTDSIPQFKKKMVDFLLAELYWQFWLLRNPELDRYNAQVSPEENPIVWDEKWNKIEIIMLFNSNTLSKWDSYKTEIMEQVCQKIPDDKRFTLPDTLNPKANNDGSGSGDSGAKLSEPAESKKETKFSDYVTFNLRPTTDVSWTNPGAVVAINPVYVPNIDSKIAGCLDCRHLDELELQQFRRVKYENWTSCHRFVWLFLKNMITEDKKHKTSSGAWKAVSLVRVGGMEYYDLKHVFPGMLEFQLRPHSGQQTIAGLRNATPFDCLVIPSKDGDTPKERLQNYLRNCDFTPDTDLIIPGDQRQVVTIKGKAFHYKDYKDRGVGAVDVWLRRSKARAPVESSDYFDVKTDELLKDKNRFLDNLDRNKVPPKIVKALSKIDLDAIENITQFEEAVVNAFPRFEKILVKGLPKRISYADYRDTILDSVMRDNYAYDYVGEFEVYISGKPLSTHPLSAKMGAKIMWEGRSLLTYDQSRKYELEQNNVISPFVAYVNSKYQSNLRGGKITEEHVAGGLCLFTSGGGDNTHHYIVIVKTDLAAVSPLSHQVWLYTKNEKLIFKDEHKTSYEVNSNNKAFLLRDAGQSPQFFTVEDKGASLELPWPTDVTLKQMYGDMEIDDDIKENVLEEIDEFMTFLSYGWFRHAPKDMESFPILSYDINIIGSDDIYPDIDNNRYDRHFLPGEIKLQVIKDELRISFNDSTKIASRNCFWIVPFYNDRRLKIKEAQILTRTRQKKKEETIPLTIGKIAQQRDYLLFYCGSVFRLQVKPPYT